MTTKTTTMLRLPSACFDSAQGPEREARNFGTPEPKTENKE